MRWSVMLEAEMAHRFIGQERLGFASDARPASSLDGLAGMLDWNEIAALLGGIYSNAKAAIGQAPRAAKGVEG